MFMRSPITPSALIAMLAACSGAESPARDPVREEAAIYAADSHWLADAQTHGLERAFRAAAQE